MQQDIGFFPYLSAFCPNLPTFLLKKYGLCNKAQPQLVFYKDICLVWPMPGTAQPIIGQYPGFRGLSCQELINLLNTAALFLSC